MAERDFASRQLRDLSDDPWGTLKVMWESRLKDLETQIAELGDEIPSSASVALLFRGAPVLGERNIRADFAAQALEAYQKIIALAFAVSVTDEVRRTGRFPKTDLSRLFVRDLARGSVGFILEELPTDSPQLMPTALKSAVESASEMMKLLSSPDAGEFEKALGSVQGRTVVAVQRFAKVLADAGAQAEVAGDDVRVELDHEAVDRLYTRLADISLEETPEELKGLLLGILPESHQFELQLDNGETIRGSISDEFAIHYRADGAPVLKRVSALVRVARTLRKGEVIREQITLDRVEPRDRDRELQPVLV